MLQQTSETTTSKLMSAPTIQPPINTLNKPVRNIYFDMQATTPIDPRVLDAMMPFQTSLFGNPHSRTHKYGWESEKAVEDARVQVASLINADAKDIIFTSGATEANNIALKGLARFKKQEMQQDSSLLNESMPHFITLQTEHKCVLDTLRNLENEGYLVTYLPVLSDGMVDLGLLRKSIKPNTVCVSIMGINNEIGAVQPLNKIGKICKEANVIFHTDGAQAFGKIPIDVEEMNIGLMGISGHKIYGPKGVGALYVRRRPRVRIQPLFHGGGQERGLRSGTVPVALVVGLGKAAEVSAKEMVRDFIHAKKMSSKLINLMRNNLGDVLKNGYEEVEHQKKDILIEDQDNGSKSINDIYANENPYSNKVENQEKLQSNSSNILRKFGNMVEKIKSLKWYPGCVNLSFPYVEGEGLMMHLKNIALSSGSACTSASLEPSYTLRALGKDEDLAHSSIRFGLGRFTNNKEVKEVADETIKAVKKLRDMSPLYEMVNEGIDLKSIEWSQE